MANTRTPAKRTTPRKPKEATPPAIPVEVIAADGSRVRRKGVYVTLPPRRPGLPKVDFQLVDEVPALALLELSGAADEREDGQATVRALLQFVNAAVPEDTRDEFRDHLLNAQPPIGIAAFNEIVQQMVENLTANPSTPPSS